MSAALAALRAVSARLGRDPLQVQGPGGNTSVKTDGTMWVKASGTWLAEAGTREIMVPVDAAGLKAALAAGGPADAAEFALGDGGLRPSIETAFHAALDWPVVLHTHCVASIAVAVRADAAAVVAERLGDLGAVFVPYVRPGVELARAILRAVTSGTRVIVLGNHGLIVAEETPQAAEALLRAVSARLDPGSGAAPDPDPDPAFAAALAGTGLAPVDHGPTRRLALEPALLALADGPTLYPDHLVFLGPGVTVARAGETVAAAVDRAAREGPARRLVLVPGQGAAIPEGASPSMRALAHALGDVIVRIEPGAALTRLDPAEEHGLLNWDAEKHRQALEAARGRA